MSYSLVGMCLSYVMFYNYALHTCFILSMGFYASWNGSKRYFKMLTKYYEKKMRKLIKSEEAKKDN